MARTLFVFLVVALIMVMSSCSDITNIGSSVCEVPCYDGPPETYNVGECSAGIPVCIENSFIECVGQKLPSIELCNGLDDNCNGRPDEAVHDDTIGEGCGSDEGECSSGSIQCYKGELTCYAEVTPTIETCNGKDDDCNGLVDDVVLSSYCYSGDAQTLAHLPCHAGVLVCSEGVYECVNEMLPSAEVCDGLDNNCNGRVDEGLSLKTYEVVFAIDRSCSMLSGSFREGVGAMVKAASEYTGIPEVKFAIVFLPDSDENPVPILATDFVNSTQAVQAANDLKGLSGSGLEPTYDVIRSVVDNTLGLSFTENSERFLFLWTDEPGQTYTLPLIHEQGLSALIAGTALTFVSFTPHLYLDSFDEIGMASGGGAHGLTSASDMGDTIIKYLDVGCEE